MNIIRVLHLDAGYPNPLENNFGACNLRKGITRELGVPPQQKLPITCAILMGIIDKLYMRNVRDISFWCACCTAFFGFFRKSTLLPKNAKDAGSDCLLRKDLRMPSKFEFVLSVRKTKTVQFGQRILRVPFVAAP